MQCVLSCEDFFKVCMLQDITIVLSINLGNFRTLLTLVKSSSVVCSQSIGLWYVNTPSSSSEKNSESFNVKEKKGECQASDKFKLRLWTRVYDHTGSVAPLFGTQPSHKGLKPFVKSGLTWVPYPTYWSALHRLKLWLSTSRIHEDNAKDLTRSRSSCEQGCMFMLVGYHTLGHKGSNPLGSQTSLGCLYPTHEVHCIHSGLGCQQVESMIFFESCWDHQLVITANMEV